MSRVVSILAPPRGAGLIALAVAVIQSAAFIWVGVEAGRMVDSGLAGDGSTTAVVRLAAAVGLLIVSMGLVVFFGAHNAAEAGLRLRLRMFDHLDGNRLPVETAVARFTNDVTVLQSMTLTGLTVVLPAAVLALLSALAAVWIEPFVGVTLLVIVLLLTAATLTVLRVSTERSRGVPEELDTVSAAFRDALDGAHVARLVNPEGRAAGFGRAAGRLQEASVAAGYGSSALVPTITVGAAIGTTVIVWLMLGRIDDGQSTPGSLTQLVAFLGLASGGIVGLANGLFLLPYARVAAERIGELLDSPAPSPMPERPTPARSDTIVELDHATIEGPDAASRRLDAVSMTVDRGEQAFVVGRSRAGKSTLLGALAGTEELDGGVLRHRRDPHAIVDPILVPTESTLTGGSVRHAVALARPGVSDDVIWTALEACQAAEFVEAKGGLDAVIEPGATNFSGGEKQRLLLARALVSGSAAVLAEDPLRGLDSATAAAVWEGFSGQLRERSLVVARETVHEAAVSAQRVVLIEDGRIDDEGSHEELLERSELYCQLNGKDRNDR